MALIEKGRVCRITASGGGNLTAPPNQSYRVTDVFCVGSSSDTYLTLINGGRTVNKIRVVGLSGNHAPYPAQKTTQYYELSVPGLFRFWRGVGLDMAIPVPSGFTLTVSRYAETGDVCLIYDAYDAGDVKADDPNGPDALVQRYLHYATNAAAIAASPVSVASDLIWTGGPGWPFDASQVPAGVEFHLFGIQACPVARGNNTANKGYTTLLTLWKNGDVLLDNLDQAGLPFLGVAATTADADTYGAAGSIIGSMTGAHPTPPLVFDRPLVFKPGDTLLTQVTVSGAASGGIGAAGLDVAFALERVRAA